MSKYGRVTTRRLPITILALCAALSACQSTGVRPAAGAAPDSAAVAVGPQRCEALAGTQLGSATIERAEPVERGEQMIGFFQRMLFKLAAGRAMPDLKVQADFCRVVAKLRPVAGSEITAELWLPQQWNGKLLAVGGGGFNGSIRVAPIVLRMPLAKGYVAMSTDAGHESTETAKFAHDFPEQYKDFAYRANHVAADFAKLLAASYYGMPVKRAYFQGCSNGGRDALMEAKRFPDDYDGIIAGAPAAGWSKLMTAFAWNAKAVQAAPNLKNKLKLVQEAVIAQCDALDGVKDHLLENPANCPFDPATLQCKSGDGDDCLNADEVAALHSIYGGPRLSDGAQVYAGVPVGGEGLRKNWEEWIVSRKSTQANFARESFRWMVYGDSEWDLSRFEINRDYPKARETVGPIMDSDDADLNAFARSGGKLLMYHGWNDAAIPAGATLDYYTALRKALGPVAEAQARLFMVPGMMHCGAGVGPTDFDMLDEMDRWVDSGVAPERILTTEYDPPALLGPGAGATVVRTRPLCPWPKVARYKGSGSTDEAANFNCE